MLKAKKYGKTVIMLIYVILSSLCSCQNTKDEKIKPKIETKKILKTEEYFYDKNKVKIKITGGIDNKISKYIQTYDERNNLLENYCETDGFKQEYKYDEENRKIYSKDNGGLGHEYFYEYDKNGDMIYFHSTSGGAPSLQYYAEYKNHKLIHRYSKNDFGESHEWWNFSEDFTKCNYESTFRNGEYYEYDLNGNKTYEKTVDHEYFYKYDDKGYLIFKKEILNGGEPRISTYKYDEKGNRIYENIGSDEIFYDYEYYDDGRIKSMVMYRIIVTLPNRSSN